ncbi:MAG TPA: universal stress protein [Chloroflexota bacterium]|nr:universal stress protein [Chloroflexota bacterium]
MYQHILVPVDFSERNPQALMVALEMARMGNGRVSLLHVIKLISGALEDFQDFYEKLEAEAHAKMTTLIASQPDVEIALTSHIIVGHRVEEILRFAAGQDVDLIVMSSHKIDLQHPDEGWGTISHKVSILAQCPVLLVK